MNELITSYVKRVTNAESAEVIETIQNLWSGYGKIIRCKINNGSSPSVIVKQIELSTSSNHPRGWNTDIGHQRKLRSYQIETRWYEHFNNQCENNCRTPKCLGIDRQDGNVIIVLEDLDAAGFPIRKSSTIIPEMNACLKWLANFHATFMGVKPDDLWPVGTYWHLDTRPEELKALDDALLKTEAKTIDHILNNCKHQSLVHGDAKLANFCFSENGENIAAVDFQYVGGGCGMKDIAYFIGSCLNENECEIHEKDLLDVYFEALKSALVAKKSTINLDELEKEWRSLFPIAWTDFHRFLKGWSPGHWKLNSYSERMAKKVIAELNKKLNSEQLKNLARVASQAAKTAGELIKNEYNKQHTILTKVGGNTLASQVVTEVDLQSQEIILAKLEPTCSLHDLGLLTEEKADDKSRLTKNHFWSIDPLDGTLPFVEGKAGFSVAIALVSRAGKSVIGVVYDPITDILYQAIEGQGCLRNGVPWTTEKPTPHSNFLFTSNRSFGSLPTYQPLKLNIENLASSLGFKSLIERQVGGAVMNAIWLLEEAPGCYVALAKTENGGGSIWDYAATVCIFNELGIPPLNCQGSAIFLNDPDTTFMNKQGVFYASSNEIKTHLVKEIVK